jgi:hypothetical protein
VLLQKRVGRGHGVSPHAFFRGKKSIDAIAETIERGKNESSAEEMELTGLTLQREESE